MRKYVVIETTPSTTLDAWNQLLTTIRNDPNVMIASDLQLPDSNSHHEDYTGDLDKLYWDAASYVLSRNVVLKLIEELRRMRILLMYTKF